MMDIERFELATRANLAPACNGTDQRLDALITLQMEILRELQAARAEKALAYETGRQFAEELSALLPAPTPSEPAEPVCDVTTHSELLAPEMKAQIDNLVVKKARGARRTSGRI